MIESIVKIKKMDDQNEGCELSKWADGVQSKNQAPQTDTLSL